MNKLKLVYRRGGQPDSVILEQTDIKLGKKGARIELPDESEIADIHAQIKWDAETKAYTVIREHKDYPLIDQHEQDVPEIALKDGVVFKIGSTSFECVRAKGYARLVDNITHVLKKPRRIPPLTDAPNLQDFFRDKTLYRIAVMGSQGSGKTCYLASLDLHTQTEGPSCTRRPTLIDHPNDHKSKAAETAYVDFEQGAEILDEAVKCLRQGKKPLKTKLEQIGRYIYEFSAPPRSSIWVETIDYPGERITQKSGQPYDNNQNKIHDRIKNILHSAHGLIILSQIPLPGTEAPDEIEELHLLIDVFHEITIENPIPVVVAVSKWDRISSFDPETATTQSEQKALDCYLDSLEGKPLKALYNEIFNRMKGDARIMPLSALGKWEYVEVPDDNNKGGPPIKEERPPKIQQLRPFGLLEPFLWLIEQADRHAVEGYEKRVKSTSLERPWRVLWSPELRTIRNWQRNLHMRKMADPGLKERLRRADDAFKRHVFWAKTSLVAAGLLMLAMAEFAFSSGKYRQAARSLRQDIVVCTNTYTNAKANESVLSSYGSNPARHRLSKLWFSGADARRIRGKSRQKREKYLMHSIANTNNAFEMRVECFRLYQQDFHDRPDYTDNLSQWRTSIGGELLATIYDVTADYEARLANAGLFLGAWPEDRESRRVEDIKKDLEAGKNIILAAGDYQRTLAGIQNALQNNLVSRATIGIRIQAIQSELEGELLGAVNKAVKDVVFDDRISVLRGYRDLFHADNSLSNLVVLLKLAMVRLDEAKQDKEQYDILAKSQTVAQANAYINNASIPHFMREHVDAFQSSRQFIIESIVWSKKTPRYDDRECAFSILVGTNTLRIWNDIKPERGKERLLNRESTVPATFRDLSTKLTLKMTFKTKTPFYRDPEFIGSVSLGQLGISSVAVTLYETKNTGHERNHVVKVRKGGKDGSVSSLPRAWKPQSYKRLDSREWE